MSTKWQRLCPANQTDLPPLLFKYHLASNGYELYMTDLTNVWSEQLCREDILKRANNSGTPIDPSEDAEQYQMLLQKIGDAFHHEKDTHVTLDKTSPGTDTLRLTTSTKLPRPLGSLEWSLYLEKQPPSSLAQYMLIPLIEAEADWESRQQNLMDQLKRKDWILSKLFDKLDAVGVDLSTIFPGISGLRADRKGTTQSHGAKHIKGVAPFDEDAWLEEHQQSFAGTNLASNLHEELSFASEAVTQSDSLRPPPENWWYTLSAAGTTSLPKREDVGRTEAPKPSRDAGLTDTASGTDTEDDEFERQETPPRLKRSKDPVQDIPSARKSPVPDQEPAKPSPSPSPRKPPIKASKGLGKIGGSKPAPAQETRSSPSPGPKPTHTSPIDGDETGSGSDSDLGRGVPPPRKPAPQAQTTPPAKPRGGGLGLGRIGGQRKQEQKQASPTPTPSRSPSPKDNDDGNNKKNTHSPPPQTNPPTKRRGLGTIGGKKKEPTPIEPPESQQPNPISPKPKPTTGKKFGVIGGGSSSKSSKPSPTSSFTHPPPTSSHHAGTETDDDDDENDNPVPKAPASQLETSSAIKSKSPDEPNPSTARASEPPKEPETEEDKANRKREELKRQLEAKAKAPVKKKRKF